MERRTAAFIVSAALVAGFWGPGTALAQSTTDDTTTVKYPDDNVSSGEVSGRRPGLWVSSSIGTVTERQSSILYSHDGASPSAKEDAELRTNIIVAAIESLFSTLQDLFSATNLLSALSGTSTTTTTTSGSSS